MVTFKAVKNPKLLKPTPMTMADVQAMEHGEQANRGVTVAARQLNCKYRDNTTFVVPIDSKVEPFKFTGSVSPDDVAAWFEWKYAEASAE